MKKAVGVIVALLLAGAIVYGGIDVYQVYRPTDNWRASTPEEQGMDSQVLADMFNYIEEEAAGKIDSVTIVRNGYLVADTYFFPFQKGLTHSLNSCTKSVLSALVGIAIDDGYIKSVDDKVLDYFPEMEIANLDGRKQDLTIRDLLTMSTGLDWQFDGNVSTNQMLQSPSWTGFVLDLPMREEPGQSFNYCNGAAQVISAIIQRATGMSAWQFAKEKLPLGFENLYWSSSPENVSSGWSGIYMRPIDMAKLGYLYLQGGKWNGRQIVPAAWIEESTREHAKADWTPLLPGYGYMWWKPRFGGYAALGDGGNYIFVVPELQLVAVFTGALFTSTGENLFFPAELMEKYVLPSVKSRAALEPNPDGTASLHKALETIGTAPPPKPVPPLPEIAREISGKTYTLENSGQVRFTFADDGECTFEQWPNHESCRIGLDDVFRINDIGNANGDLPDHNHSADKGGWLDERTLQGVERILESGLEMVYTFRFTDDRIEIVISFNNIEIGRLQGKLE